LTKTFIKCILVAFFVFTYFPPEFPEIANLFTCTYYIIFQIMDNISIIYNIDKNTLNNNLLKQYYEVKSKLKSDDNFSK